MTINVFYPLPNGTKIACNCDDEQCWKQVEVAEEGFTYEEDSSDLSGQSYVADFDLPEGVFFCRMSQVEPNLSDDDLVRYLKESFKVFEMQLPNWIVRMVLPAMHRQRSYYEQVIDSLKKA